MGWRAFLRRTRDEVPGWTVALPQLPRLVHQAVARASAPVALTELALLRERRRTNRLLVIIILLLAALTTAFVVSLI
jgi:ubiquinone biosynthesis protein